MSFQDRWEHVELANTAVINSSAVQNLQNEILQRRHLLHLFNIDTLCKKPMGDGLNSAIIVTFWGEYEWWNTPEQRNFKWRKRFTFLRHHSQEDLCPCSAAGAQEKVPQTRCAPVRAGRAIVVVQVHQDIASEHQVAVFLVQENCFRNCEATQ